MTESGFHHGLHGGAERSPRRAESAPPRSNDAVTSSREALNVNDQQ
jgi:hypothetical protein